MFEATSWKELTTIAAALLGAVLGIMNTWNALAQRRVRLRVRPANVRHVGGGIITMSAKSEIGAMFCIEVTNLSAFPVTIDEVGMTMGRTTRMIRAAVPIPKIFDGKPWPRRLEPRESVSLYADIDSFEMRGPQIRRAYASTACGCVRYGNSPALRQLRGFLAAQTQL
jgi:hypothetical protein